MASPTYTANANGNILASSSLGAGASSANLDIDLSDKWGGIVQVAATFGTVAATAGLQISIYGRVGTTPGVDTEPIFVPVLPATTSTSKALSLTLPGPAKYRVVLKNLDASNGLTAVSVSMDTQDGIA